MCTQDFAEGVKQKFVAFFAQKLHDLASVLNKLIQLKRITDGHGQWIFSDCERGPGGGTSSRLIIFAIFLQKNRDFGAILITFRTFEAIRITKFLKFRSHFRKLNCLAPSALPLLQVKSKMRLNARILSLNFSVTWLMGLKPFHTSCAIDSDHKILSVL